MAKLTFDGRSMDLADGEQIADTAMELGIPFGCKNGLCQSCRIEVVSGMENLSDLTQEEKDIDLDEKTRLACQCKIKSGEVVIQEPQW